MVERLGSYELDRVIGHGAMAEVWLAWAPGAADVALAIKRWRPGGLARTGLEMTPEGMARLAAEAELLAQLDHPSIVEVIEVVPDPPGVALVMPYLPGGSLRSLLNERGTLGPGEVVALFAPVASALGALADAGMVHGDLKPDNVLLTDAGEPVLADVGVARAVGSRSGSGRVAGTPEYLDPALVDGAAASGRSDVFALGVMAYEALTGRLPHRGDPAEVVALAAAGVHRPLGSWPSVPADVAAVVEAALHPDPDRRAPDAASFVAGLASTVAPAAVVLPGPVSDRSSVGAVERTGNRTIDFPLNPPPPVRRSDHRIGLALVVCGLLASVGIAMAARARFVRSPRHLVPSSCPSTLPGPGSGRLSWADLDGDRCADPVRWDGRTLVATTAGGTRSYRLGAPGDQLLLGDWDGDGRATPALYRPSAGRVHYVDHLPGRVGDRVGATRSESVPRNGRARVVPGPPDQVQVVGS